MSGTSSLIESSSMSSGTAFICFAYNSQATFSTEITCRHTARPALEGSAACASPAFWLGAALRRLTVLWKDRVLGRATDRSITLKGDCMVPVLVRVVLVLERVDLEK